MHRTRRFPASLTVPVAALAAAFVALWAAAAGAPADAAPPDPDAPWLRPLPAPVMTPPQPPALETIRLARRPAPSPREDVVVFGWRGDLWTAPVDGTRPARRLTVHEAYDHGAVFSPDGRWIAFTSDRHGNDDVYVMAAAGGAPRRLTHRSTGDRATGWEPDGSAVLFETRRWTPFGWEPETWSVPVEGGEPTPLFGSPNVKGGEAVIAPDGRHVAYVRGAVDWWRKRYRGSADMDVWLFDRRTGRHRQLTDHDGNDHHPQFNADGTRILWRTDADGHYEMWSMDLDGSARLQLTDFGDGSVRFPRAAGMPGGETRVIFERRDGLTGITVDAGAADTEPWDLDLKASPDLRWNPTELQRVTSGADQMAVGAEWKHGDEKVQEAAVVVRGELIVLDMEDGTSRTVAESPWRERDPAFSKDGRTLWFVSDRHGQEDLFTVTSADPDEPRLSHTLKITVERVTETDAPEFSPTFSPQGDRVAYVRGRGDLVVRNVETGEETVVLEGFDTPSISWSPDGAWIAFARDDDEFNSDVWITASDGSTRPYNVTRHPDYDGSPTWSRDGRFLTFSSRRTGDDGDLWVAFLRQADWEMDRKTFEDSLGKPLPSPEPPADPEPEPDDPEDPDDPDDEDGDDDGDEEDGDDEKAKPDGPPPVHIDFEDLWLRQRRITSEPGNEYGLLTGDSKQFVYVWHGSMYAKPWSGSAKEISSGDPSGFDLTPDGKRLQFLAGGRPTTMGVDGRGRKTHGFSARITVDLRAERAQKFDEAWRLMNLNFYDGDFHGADWPAVRERYRPWALEAHHVNDFNDVVRLMLGELNASHLGIYGGDMAGEGGGGSATTGALGIRAAHVPAAGDAPAGFRVVEVVPGSPADRQESRLEPGDVIRQVDGRAVADSGDAANLSHLMQDTFGERVLLAVVGADGTEREVVIRPITPGAVLGLRYQQWVRETRRRVEARTRGRVGYVHIQGMNTPSLEQFERELYAVAHDKDSLLIDVRWNGGGWTTDYLLAILRVERHAYTIPRGGGRGYPQGRLPLYAWTKPVGLLTNQFAFSNAEIFSHAFRTLELGPITGQPTYGAVISTGGTRLIDGAFLRMPFRGWYVIDPDDPGGRGRDMEFHAAVPHNLVPMSPEDEAAGRDRQLERAIRSLVPDLEPPPRRDY